VGAVGCAIAGGKPAGITVGIPPGCMPVGFGATAEPVAAGAPAAGRRLAAVGRGGMCVGRLCGFLLDAGALTGRTRSPGQDGCSWY
jgi:hypothetical protein